jgi:hypothetical protein
LRDAIGISIPAQDAILLRVTGRERTEGRAGGRRKQLEWRTFIDFISAMQDRQNSISIISAEVLAELNSKFSDVIKKQLQDEIIQRHPVKQLPVPKDVPEKIKLIPEQTGVTFKLFLPPKIANFSANTYSAYMTACFLVAQSATDVSDLAVGKPMSSEVLHFLLDTPPINFWLEHSWMRTHKKNSSIYFLTKSGLDECKSRLLTSIGKNDSRLGNAFTKEQVEVFREVILNGPNSKDVNQIHKFIERIFRDNSGMPAGQILEQKTIQLPNKSKSTQDSEFNERAIAYWKKKWAENKNLL